MPENNPTKNEIKLNTYQYRAPGPTINMFRDRDANAAVRNAILGTAGSALKNATMYGIQNRQADKALFNQWLGVRNQLAQMQGYSDYADICLTGDCPTRPFLGDPPTFRDWRRGDEDFGDSRDEYREYLGPQFGYSDTPLRNKGIVRDALVTGAGTAATTYLGNKLLGSFPAGRRLQDNFEFKFGLQPTRRYQAAGPYGLPTSAATSGYTSTMSGMAGANQSAMQLAQIEQEIQAEQERRRQEDEAADAARKTQLQQEAKGLASKEFLDTASKAAKDVAGRRAAEQLARQQTQEIAKSVSAEGLDQALNLYSSANIPVDSSQLISATGKEAIKQGTQQVGQEAGKQVATEAGKNFGLAASSANPSWANPAAAVAAIGGRAIEHVADDDDDTRVTAGEGIGRGLAGAGQGASIGLMFGPVGGLIGAGVGALASLTAQQIQKKRAREAAAKEREFDNALAAAENYAFVNSLVRQGQDMGYNVGNSMTNSYLPGQQQFVGKAGGWPWPDKEARMLNQQRRQTKKAQRLFEKASKKAKRKGGSALDYMQ